MALKIDKVPLIAITPDGDDEEDDKNFSNIADVKTDIEDLDNGEEQNKQRKKVHRLKHKKTKNDGGLTDVEDIEGSDNEECEIIMKHKEPIQIENAFDLDPGTYEETYKIESLQTKGNKKLRKQESTASIQPQQFLGLAEDGVTEGLTDIEDINDSDNDAIYEIPDIPDAYNDLLIQPLNVSITDKSERSLHTKQGPDATSKDSLSDEDVVEYKKSKKTVSRKLSSKNKRSNLLTPRSLSPQLSDLTDTEIINSDSDENEIEKYKRDISPKRKRIRVPGVRTKDMLTDTEDLNLSDDEKNDRPKLTREISISKRPGFCTIRKKMSEIERKHICDSDHDTDTEVMADREEISPLTPKKAAHQKRKAKRELISEPFSDDDEKIRNIQCQKAKMTLEIFGTDEGGTTDLEDFEVDDIKSDSEQEIQDPIETPQILKDLESCYAGVMETIKSKEAPRLYTQETYKVKKDQPIFDDQDSTDVEEYETCLAKFDDDLRIDEDVDFEVKFVKVAEKEILFSSESTKKKQKNIKRQSNPSSGLVIPETLDEIGVTDTEDLNDSNDENDDKSPLQIAIVKRRKSSDTDSESFQDDCDEDEEMRSEIAITLPDSTRELIHIKIDRDGKPITTVSPLPDDNETGLFTFKQDTVPTDSEEISEDDEKLIVDEQVTRKATPDLPPLDGGITDLAESLKVPDSASKHTEELTDSEMVFLDSNKHKKIKKNKTLQLKRDDASVTDREDIEISDTDGLDNNLEIVKKYSLSVFAAEFVPEAKTDVEDLQASGDELDPCETVDLTRALSSTPDMMKYIGGTQTVVTKEGSDRFNDSQQKTVCNTMEIPKIEMTSASPDYQPTDTEDVFTSADEEFVSSYSRAETATPMEYEECATSQVNVKYTGKFDETEEILHIKGGGYIRDTHTDVEDLGLSDDEYQYEIKNQIQFDGDQENNRQEREGRSFPQRKPEWTPSGKQLQPAAGGRPQIPTTGTIKEDVAQQGEVSQTAQSPSQQKDPPSSTTGETQEESEMMDQAGAVHSTPRRDQHELSDEMKELLAQMEEDSRK